MVYTIDPHSSALLIIDPQREYFDAGRPLYTDHAKEILANLVKLRDAAAKAQIPTVIVQHLHKADGSDVGRMGDFDSTPLFVEGTQWVDLISEMSPQEGDILIRKNRYSAFVNTKLDSMLRSLKIDTLIITGLMTNYCCVTTARHAHDADYKVVFVADANAAPDLPDLGFGPVPHDEILRVVATSLAGGIADVTTTESVIEQMKVKT